VSLLLRFWPYLTGLTLLIGAATYMHHAGYESGYAASEAHYRPLFDAADKARAAADARARTLDQASKALSAKTEADYAASVSSLNLRVADAERRYAGILRQRPTSASCRTGPGDGASAGGADAAGASDELIERTSRDFGTLVRRCEADATTLTALQKWVREQQALFVP
jgi:hypothetical protein